MAALGISSEEFYDMSPIELYYAYKGLGEQREMQFQQDLVVSRFNAWLQINHQIGRTQQYIIRNVQDLHRFGFEEGGIVKSSKEPEKKQSVEEQKAILLSIAGAHNKQVERTQRTTPPIFKKK